MYKQASAKALIEYLKSISVEKFDHLDEDREIDLLIKKLEKDVNEENER